ncbi:hypothetical protein CDD83_7546 [Cordyceps sp. RAO-2017]|nr:hypothetical protein CDD83_7546 [Cordyceps sp. RAO-2017]
MALFEREEGVEGAGVPDVDGRRHHVEGSGGSGGLGPRRWGHDGIRGKMRVDSDKYGKGKKPRSRRCRLQPVCSEAPEENDDSRRGHQEGGVWAAPPVGPYITGFATTCQGPLTRPLTSNFITTEPPLHCLITAIDSYA